MYTHLRQGKIEFCHIQLVAFFTDNSGSSSFTSTPITSSSYTVRGKGKYKQPTEFSEHRKLVEIENERLRIEKERLDVEKQRL
jgi:hypothetical protein